MADLDKPGPFGVTERELRNVATAAHMARTAPRPEAPRCAAVIWPSSWSGWGQCPGVVIGGRCSVYGHRPDPEPAPEPALVDPTPLP